jgi:hypothetical protein
MPAVKIQKRILSEREQELAELKWGSHDREIWSLPPNQFKMWLYSMEPTEAMLVACSERFKIFRLYKLHKWRMIWQLICGEYIWE